MFSDERYRRGEGRERQKTDSGLGNLIYDIPCPTNEVGQVDLLPKNWTRDNASFFIRWPALQILDIDLQNNPLSLKPPAKHA